MKTKSYIIENKKLMSEWDWDANTDLEPKTLTLGSNKKAWWICSHCGHKWKTTIHHRAVRKQDCPKCRYLLKKHISSNLTETHPQCLKYWDFSKNKLLKPEIVSEYSGNDVWWKCPDCGHEWEEKIKNQVKKLVFCPHCKKGIKDLASMRPELLKEWDTTKNAGNPKYIPYASNKYAWWKCSKCGYEWKAKISNRSVLNRGCPCCSEPVRVVVAGINDLKTKFPHIANEWHPTKNGNLLPEQVTGGAKRKVWWLCPLGHEYQATINHRTHPNGTNCPICYSGRQTSFAEQAVFFYINKLYPDAISRYKADFLGKFELDIYIPSIKCAIEYDGEAWHKENKVERETRKYLLCKEHDITLVRLREQMPDEEADIADYMIGTKNLYEHKNLEKVLKQLVKWISSYQPVSDDFIDLNRDQHKISEYRKSAISDSLVVFRPDIAMEWHPTKNGNLTPDMFKKGSSYKPWWKCPKCGHEYQTAICHRTRNGTSCPKCAMDKNGESSRIGVQMISLETKEILKTFVSISEAGRQMKINPANIGMVCRGHRNHAGGYAWRYVKEHDNINRKK